MLNLICIDESEPTIRVTCCMSHVTCHMSHVTCYRSHVTCHMSHIISHMSHVAWSHIANRTENFNLELRACTCFAGGAD